MNIQTRHQKHIGKTTRRHAAGFNRTELLVVIAVIVVLAMLAFLGMTFGKQRMLRAHCQSNLGQIDKALQSYAADNNNLLPDCTRKNPAFFGTGWPWDLSQNLVSELENRGAGRKFLYCPSNIQMDDDADWNYWQFHGGHNRVSGYGFLLNGNIPEAPSVWHTNIMGDGIKPPAQTELVFDAVISNDGQFTGIQASQPRRTSHLQLFNSKQPAGGNIAFEDGHVEWRTFNQMQDRFFTRGFNPVAQIPTSVNWYY